MNQLIVFIVASLASLALIRPIAKQHLRTPASIRTGTAALVGSKALVTERVGPDHAWMPFHFAGWWQGHDLKQFYPEGAAPVVRGEAVNTATTYGYDSVTMMQETKTTICQIEKAAA